MNFKIKSPLVIRARNCRKQHLLVLCALRTEQSAVLQKSSALSTWDGSMGKTHSDSSPVFAEQSLAYYIIIARMRKICAEILEN